MVISVSPTSGPVSPLAILETSSFGKLLVELPASLPRRESFRRCHLTYQALDSQRNSSKPAAAISLSYTTARYLMAGRGSLAGLMPYGNANDVVLSMASEVLPVVSHIPVLAGVCASDPFRDIPQFLRQLKD